MNQSYIPITGILPPSSDDFAFMHWDGCEPIIDYMLTFRTSPVGAPHAFITIHMSAEETSYFNIQGKPPKELKLESYRIYRLLNSRMTTATDKEHIIITLSDKSIELVGKEFYCSHSLNEASAIKALIKHAQNCGVGS